MRNWKTICLLILLLTPGCTTTTQVIEQQAKIDPPTPTYVQSVAVEFKVIKGPDGTPYVATTFGEYKKLTAYINDLVRYMKDSNAVINYYAEPKDAPVAQENPVLSER